MRKLTLAAALAAAALAAAGCGDDDEDTGGSEPATTGTSSSAQKQKVDLVDFKIEPANPALKAGATEFAVVNAGKAPHALAIEADGEDFETDVLQAGQKATLSVNLKKGEYTWYCPVGDHRSRGMEGTVTVDGDGGGSGSGSGSGSGGGY